MTIFFGAVLFVHFFGVLHVTKQKFEVKHGATKAWKKRMQQAAMDGLQGILEQPKAP